MPPPPPRPRSLELRVAWCTLLKLSVFAAIVFVTLKLLPLLGLLLLALLIAITLWPVARAIERRGGPKWLGLTVCSVLLLGSFGLFMFFVSPVAAGQISSLIKALPSMKEHVLKALPGDGVAHELADSVLQNPAFKDPAPLLKQFMAWGIVAATAFLEFLVVLIVAIYLIADGQRVYEWLIAFLPARHRQRVAEAAPEIQTMIYSYMGGQLITSLLCSLFIWGTLTAFHVPNALLLAVVGGVFDVLPIIGFFLSLGPALAFALTVSPLTAGAVAALYTLYHLIENYFIVPKVYGDRLRLSTLTVLVACMAAGVVGGVVGVIVILPILASFPTIERTWLKPVFGKETVDRHDAIEEQEHPAAG